MDYQEALEYRQFIRDYTTDMPLAEKRAVLREEWADLRTAREVMMQNVAPPVAELAIAETRLVVEQLQEEVSEEPPAESNKRPRYDETASIAWAGQLLDDFKVSGAITTRRRSIQDRHFIRERLRSGLDGAPPLLEPQVFLTAFDTWRAKSLSGDARATRLVDTVSEQALHLAKEHWRTFDADTIGAYIKAAYSKRLSSGVAHNLLRTYFQGPATVQERVGVYYQLGNSMLDMYDDPEAMAHATRIGLFQTPIIKHGSDMEIDIFVAHKLALDDPETMQKADISRSIFQKAAAVLEIDLERERADIELSSSPRFHSRILACQKRIFDMNDPELTQKLFDVSNTKRHPDGTFSRATSNDTPDWLKAIYRNPQDPLYQKFQTILGSSAYVLAGKKMIEQDSYKVSRVESIVLPNGFIVDLFLPFGMMPDQERAFVADLVEHSANIVDSTKDDMQALPKKDQDLDPFTITTHTFNGVALGFGLRESSEFDRQSAHPLNELLWIGMPYAETESDDELLGALVDIQDDIEKYQHRFFNQRGIRINFDPATQIGQRGYHNVVFKEDPLRPQMIEVQLNHQGSMYRYHIDEHFGLELGGKRVSSARQRNTFLYSTLLLLRDYVCGIVLDTEEGELRSNASGPAARIDYLRYLPIGQHFTPAASGHYLERRHKDLLTKSEERKLVDPAHRNSTYVREVEQSDTTLPPLVVHIDPDEFMYHKIVQHGFKLPPDLQAK